MTSVTPSARAAKGRHSVDRLRELVRSGGFARAATLDRQTGDIADADSRALFAALPAITPATTPEELVEQRIIERLPRGLHKALERPKYRVGRELFVQSTVSHVGNGPVGRYDANGALAFTHRAVLRGQRGGDFQIEVDGAPSLLPFARADVFGWNEPCGVQVTGGTLSGVQIDYNDPLIKAHICAGYLDISGDLGQLDFEHDTAAEHQAAVVHRLAKRVHMSYVGRGDGYTGARAGSLLSGGSGVCFVQRAVAAAYLHPFARSLAFEVQAAVGRTLKHGVPHGFAVILLRPSLRRYVCDPAWSEPLTELKIAMFDAGWGHDRRLVALEGHQDLTVRPAEVDLPEVEA
ncbi:MAG: hypothetical protein HYZ27_10370 [Deltaproteobacteria bacterium]|nr:hypothetical protein [Deltaproteobacteria bacterium]